MLMETRKILSVRKHSLRSDFASRFVPIRLYCKRHTSKAHIFVVKLIILWIRCESVLLSGEWARSQGFMTVVDTLPSIGKMARECRIGSLDISTCTDQNKFRETSCAYVGGGDKTKKLVDANGIQHSGEYHLCIDGDQSDLGTLNGGIKTQISPETDQTDVQESHDSRKVTSQTKGLSMTMELGSANLEVSTMINLYIQNSFYAFLLVMEMNKSWKVSLRQC